MAKVTGKKLYWESDLFHLPSWIILQSPFKKWYSLLIQFLTIRHNHPSIRFLLPAVTFRYHHIPSPKSVLDPWILVVSVDHVTSAMGKVELPQLDQGDLELQFLEVWGFFIARSVGCACFGWGRFFVATLAAKQTKKQWLKQKTRFLF